MFVITGGYDRMNINFELYRIFYAVANAGNITKAAEELMISQPAISKSIKNLEEQLGGQLFIRTKRGVILTDEGREFYNYISRAMEYIYNAENKFKDLINLNTGTIKIGISSTLTKEFLTPHLEEFHIKYPKIDIQIVTNLSSELIPKLKNGLIDIIILNIVDENAFALEIPKFPVSQCPIFKP
jgi:DNA-binding transcriptional LysR family regulator